MRISASIETEIGRCHSVTRRASKLSGEIDRSLPPHQGASEASTSELKKKPTGTVRSPRVFSGSIRMRLKAKLELKTSGALQIPYRFAMTACVNSTVLPVPP
jgi:hypothetical protein